MAVLTHRAGSALAALLLGGTPALAQVTPEEVWTDLETYFERFGYTVSGTETREGDTLVVSDVTALTDQDGTAGGLIMGTLRLTDQGDGTVALAFADEMELRFESRNAEDEPVSVRMAYGFEGLETVVSGTPEEMTYDYTAEAVYLDLNEVEVAGERLTEEFLDGALRLTEVTGQSVSRVGTPYAVEQSLEAGGATYALSFTDAETGDTGNVTGAGEGLGWEARIAMPEGVDRENPQAMVEAGFAFSGGLSTESGSTEFVTTAEGVTTSGETSSAGAELNVAFGAEGLDYGVSATDYATTFTTPDLPFPFTASASEVGTRIALPLTAGAEPQPFRFSLTLEEVAFSELLWAILDAEGVLPRDPATLALDLSGEVINEVNLLDPEAMAALENSEGQLPGTLESAQIETLRLDAAGASLTGEGGFTFDNEDLETFDGFPRPNGSVELILTGGNALIDRLIELGVITQQDAMGARMMLSMFTVPGDDGSLTTVIEVNEQGHVLANGNRVR